MSKQIIIYNGGTNKRDYANWRKQIKDFNASLNYIFSRTASDLERPIQSQQIQALLAIPHHNWTHQETAAKQKVEQTKREWNERMQISVDYLKNSIGPNIRAGLQDLWSLTSSDQDTDFTFRDLFRQIEHDHGPTRQDTAKSRRQIMTELMAIPSAQNDQEAQKYFNKLTTLSYELDSIGADPIPFQEIKEIAINILIKECFQQDRTLITLRHGQRGRPRTLSDIIRIWRQCAEEIRQYTGQSSSTQYSSKIAATRAAEETEEQSDDEKDDVAVAAFTSRPPAGQQTFSDSRSYYNARPQQQQRPTSQQQQRPSSRPRQTEPTPGQSKLITKLQETDSYKQAEIDFLRYKDIMQRREIENLQREAQQTQHQAQQTQQQLQTFPESCDQYQRDQHQRQTFQRNIEQQASQFRPLQFQQQPQQQSQFRPLQFQHQPQQQSQFQQPQRQAPSQQQQQRQQFQPQSGKRAHAVTAEEAQESTLNEDPVTGTWMFVKD